MNQAPFQLPSDVLANLQATMHRKTAEAMQMIEQSTTTHIHSQPVSVVTIHSVEDVNAQVINAVEEVFDGFFSTDDRIDWHGFFDRLEQFGFSVESIDSPAANKVKRVVRQLKSDN